MNSAVRVPFLNCVEEHHAAYAQEYVIKAKMKLRVVQFRGLSKMTLSSLQAQATRAIYPASRRRIALKRQKENRFARFAN